MKHIIGFTLALCSVFVSSNAHAGRCGLFDIFEGNDYCVKCPTRSAEKVYACPGGEVGLVAIGMGNPGCSVSYYSASCQSATALKNTMTSKKERNKLNAEFNKVETGKPALFVEGDDIIIRMKKADFDKLESNKK